MYFIKYFVFYIFYIFILYFVNKGKANHYSDISMLVY